MIARPSLADRPHHGPAASSSPVAVRSWLSQRGEGLGLAALLLAALVARLVRLDRIEPNVLPDEADHLTLLFHVLAGQGPGIFDLSWDGNPAASLYPALPFLKLLGPTYLALRLSSALASLLTLAVFFMLARTSLGPFASLGATALLAFSSWFLFFSRNGEVNVWAVLYLVAAAYSTQLALASGRWRDWLTAGLFCGLGWYSYLGGVFILPTLLLYLLVRVGLDRSSWKRSLWAGAALSLTTVALLLPRLPILIEKWNAVELYVGTRSVLRGAALAEIPGILAQQVAISVRAFVLLDGSLPGNPRYIPPGSPPLEPLTGALYLAGLVLSLGRVRQTALWWCLLAPIILVVQSLSQPIPDGARALAALPAMLLFAGLAIDWLVTRPRFGRLALLGLCAAIPATAAWSWLHYVEWQRQPSNALARQPAVEVDEFEAWRDTQMAEIRAGRYGFTVDQWHQVRGRNRPARAAIPAYNATADGG